MTLLIEKKQNKYHYKCSTFLIWYSFLECMYTTQYELNILWKLIRCYINVQLRSNAFAAKWGGGDFATLYDSEVQEYVVVTE